MVVLPYVTDQDCQITYIEHGNNYDFNFSSYPIRIFYYLLKLLCILLLITNPKSFDGEFLGTISSKINSIFDIFSWYSECQKLMITQSQQSWMKRTKIQAFDLKIFYFNIGPRAFSWWRRMCNIFRVARLFSTWWPLKISSFI